MELQSGSPGTSHRTHRLAGLVTADDILTIVWVSSGKELANGPGLAGRGALSSGYGEFRVTKSCTARSSIGGVQ